ncbi:uncharacterized protein BDR25DRAFT_396650 [Lindgomyces ingoldianus]|uniref:Uncharacterized protein n=1 Tax=Lindgomyces ingoldianus TaxID=673940 RepID=A0ACB6QCC5_9PLEO|nr:uncharacterized protein BDR25DRAFT_396650 [Lindgomyces ingoldianus]KAF2464567.1 hypothetical protein BDR25DRAFT_396650 [Lindgomyces ingoldianus]
MSVEHSRLAETLLKSDIIRVDSSIVSQLRQSLKTFVELARVATLNEEGNDRDAQALHSLSENTFAQFDRRTPTSVMLASRSSRHAGPPTGWKAASIWPLLHRRQFGDSWLSYGPWTIAPRVVPPSIISRSLSYRSFGFGVDVIRSSLQIAYDALVDPGLHGFSHDVTQSMFQYALTDFTKEELSFIIRWYLGPGVSELPSLGFATSTFSASSEVEGKPTIQSLPHLRKGNQPGLYIPYAPALKDHYVGAFDLKSYLQGLGAFEFNLQTISMLASFPDTTMPYGEILPPLNVAGFNTSRLPGLEGRISAYQNPYNFDSFFAGSDFTQYSTYNHSAPSSETRTDSRRLLTISTPKFLQEVAMVSVCLGHGPAVLRGAIPDALRASSFYFLDVNLGSHLFSIKDSKRCRFGLVQSTKLHRFCKCASAFQLCLFLSFGYEGSRTKPSAATPSRPISRPVSSFKCATSTGDLLFLINWKGCSSVEGRYCNEHTLDFCGVFMAAIIGTTSYSYQEKVW